MKKSTAERKQKLAKYTTVAGAFLASGAVNSQIQYVDINPDTLIDITNSPYNLDLNTDATNDFVFNVDSFSGSYTNTTSSYTVTYSGTYAGVSGAGTNGVVMDASSSYPNPVALGNAIGAAANFGTGSQTLGVAGSYSYMGTSTSYSGTFTGGYFLGLNDQYLGVKFAAGANTHYGWIRLDVAADATTITIKDYAYNTIPSDSIEAGQVMGIEDVPLANRVTIKTHLDEAFVNVTPDLVGGNIIITDMSGKEVSSTPIADINTKVTYSGIDSGVYMIVARFESGIISKKIYVR